MAFLAAIPVGIIAAVSAGSAAVGAGTSIAGGVMNANAASAAGEQAAHQGRYNSMLAQFAAVDADRRGAVQAGAARSMGSRVVGAQRAAFGASGVDVQSPTAQAVGANTEAMSELDAETARNNAAREAWGFKSQSAQFQQAGAQAQAAAQGQVVGSILGGAGQLASAAGDFVGWTQRPKLGKGG